MSDVYVYKRILWVCYTLISMGLTLFFFSLCCPPAVINLTYPCLGVSLKTNTVPVPLCLSCDPRGRSWLSVSGKDNANNGEQTQALITWRSAARVEGNVHAHVCVCVDV